MDLNKLAERLKKIEALIAGTDYVGEKEAAESAKERLVERYGELGFDKDKNATEYRLYTPDSWHKKLLLALCRKRGLEPYRYHRQKYTTVMVKVNEEYLNEVLWKEYLHYSAELEALIGEITDDMINNIHQPAEETLVDQKMIGGQ